MIAASLFQHRHDGCLLGSERRKLLYGSAEGRSTGKFNNCQPDSGLKSICSDPTIYRISVTTPSLNTDVDRGKHHTANAMCSDEFEKRR